MKIKPNLESGHMGQDEGDFPAWFNALLVALMIGIALFAVQCTGHVHAQEAANAPRPAGWATNQPPANLITDLGVIGTHSIIILEKCQRRADFARFKVEILPRNARGWTNKVVINTTNEFLKIGDLMAVPEGVAIMGVRSYCANGDPSPVALFKIDVQRAPPDKPTARKAEILHMPSEQMIEHVIEAVEAVPHIDPPMPPGMTNAAPPVPTRTTTNATTRTTTRTFNQPLPGGVGDSYAQYQARLEAKALRGERLKNDR